VFIRGKFLPSPISAMTRDVSDDGDFVLLCVP
jgi:hypothetical protein